MQRVLVLNIFLKKKNPNKGCKEKFLPGAGANSTHVMIPTITHQQLKRKGMIIFKSLVAHLPS